MYLQTLGKLAFSDSTLSRPKVLVMLTYLSLEGSKDRGHLGELFYMGASDPRSSLRISLKYIRDSAENAIETEGDKVSVCVTTDARALLTALESQNFSTAFDLYEGAFLDGVRIKGASSELEEWIYETREYLALATRRAMLEVATGLAKQGDFTKAAKQAAQAFKLAGAPEPEPEQFRQLYALMLAGNAVEGLELKKLAAEYDFELDITKQEAKSLFYKEVVSTPPKAEQNIQQVVQQTEQKQVASKATNMRPRNNLFIGRSTELQEITSLLTDDNHRLVTLHGQGGIGKTRLVTHTGLELLKSDSFPDGIFFVALESLSEGSQIIPTIANSLSLTLATKTLATKTLATDVEVVDALAQQISDKNMLIIMDNFEHLMDSAIICSDILQRCPNVKLLVSSREGLNLAGEVVYEVTGLNLPASEQLSMELALDYDIIQLYIDRARHANLSYKLNDADLPHVIKICQLVEGLPLGVELAAAGLRYMPVSEIAESISNDLDMLYMPARDKAERHHSIRATFEYSWKLLSAKEQQVLVDMAVFRGGFSRDAANKVAGASLPILRSLVDKALLRTIGDGRFTRHMLLYQYTLEKFLQNPNYEAIQEKHAGYFLQFSEEGEPHLISEKQVEWLNKLEAEHENLRIALQWNLENDIEAALRQSAALRRFWEIRGYFLEGTAYLNDAVELASTKNNDNYLKAIYALAVLLRSQQNIDEAHVCLKECLLLAQELDNKPILADTYNSLGGISWLNGDLDNAHLKLNKSLELKRTTKDFRGVAVSLGNLALLAKKQQNYDLAQTLYVECLEINTKLLDRFSVAKDLRNLGRLMYLKDDFATAETYLQNGLKISDEINSQKLKGELLDELAFVACHFEQFDKALALLKQSKKIFEEYKIDRGLVNTLLGFGLVNYATNNFPKAEQYFKDSLELSYQANQIDAIAKALSSLGNIAIHKDQYIMAVNLLGASNMLELESNIIQTFLKKHYENDIAKATQQLDKSSYQKHYEEGKLLSLNEAISLVFNLEKDVSLSSS